MSEERVVMTGEDESTTQVKRQYTTKIYWYNDAYDTLVSGLGRKQSYFAVLFLAPLMLPHSQRKDDERAPTLKEKNARQRAFLAQQLAYIRDYQPEAQDAGMQLTALHDDCCAYVADYSRYSDGQINKTDSYKTVTRFLTYFKGATAEQVDSVVELYQLELERMFYRPEDASLFRAKVEAWNGWLEKRDIHIPDMNPTVDQAGRVLLYTLLVQALDELDKPKDQVAYLATVENILGAEVPSADQTAVVQLPLELFTDLVTALCQPESFTVSGGRTLLNVLQALPEYDGQAELTLLCEAAKAARMRELQMVQSFLNAGDTNGMAAASQRANELTKLLDEIAEN